MTDAERLLAALREAGPKGLHSHDIRRRALTANPSQRAADLEAKGHSIERIRENRGKRPGTRYKLIGVGAENGGRDTTSIVDCPAKPKSRLSIDPGEQVGLGAGVSPTCRGAANATPGPAPPEPTRLSPLPSESALTRRPEAA